MPLTDFICPSCLLFVLETQRVYQQNLHKITIKLVRECTSVPFSIISATLAMFIIENICNSINPKFYLHFHPDIYKNYVCDSVYLGKWSLLLRTLFVNQANRSRQSSYIEVSR